MTAASQPPCYQNQRLLLVGLGLSGVSALHYLAKQGALLSVTDSRANPKDGLAMQAAYPQFSYHFGGFSAPAPLSQFAEAIVGPGVDLREPFLQQLRDAGVPLIGDIELFARAATAPIVGITGSNGKSTVTTLLGDMAKCAGLNVGVGGNLAPPALDVLSDTAQLYVLELSSFQLDTTHSLRCQAATVLNLSEDHLDRHGNMVDYGAAKARVWNGAAYAVVPAEWQPDGEGAALLPALPSQSFSSTQPADYQVLQHEGQAWLAAPCDGISSPLLPLAELPIKGLHNASNALAALALADAAGIPRAASLAALRNFRGLPHRCVPVATLAGATYYNDSKGTNVGSTLAAINGLPAPIVWLGGGQGKGQDFSPLAAALAKKSSAAVLFGEDASSIEAAILGAVPVYRETTMQQALARAHSLAEAGGSVLLSPACASFDQFKSYVDRGLQFEAAVAELVQAHAA